MKITFVSNYINHHQIPLSDELYRLTDGEYTFIQTEPMEEERVRMGWNATVDKPYVKYYEESSSECEKLIMESECVIFGGTPRQELIIPRLEAGLFTIRYSERLYKTGRYKFISPRGLRQKFYDHTRFNHKPVYLLCAGAYVKGDFSLVGAYHNKALKFGYFPEFIEYDNVHFMRENTTHTEILWAARFIDWKHPEMMVNLARELKNAAFDAHITMIGNGELFDEVVNSAKGLEDYISFAGSRTPKEVREAMLKADIFILTSDRQEGWGAVINEAMNSGCVTMAAKETGAAPYLLKNDVNGYKYRALSEAEVFNLVSELVANPAKRRRIGNNAYETIKTTWNAKVSAKRLLEFINDENHSIDRYEEGPLSRA